MELFDVRTIWKKCSSFKNLLRQTDNNEAKALFVEIGMKYNNYKRYLRVRAMKRRFFDIILRKRLFL